MDQRITISGPPLLLPRIDSLTSFKAKFAARPRTDRSPPTFDSKKEPPVPQPSRTQFALPLVLVAFVLCMIVPAQAQTLQALHSFSGAPDGANPYAGVVMDGAGNLYGTTFCGGENGWGMVFKLAHKGSGWVLTPLYSFQSPYKGQDGNSPYAAPTIGPDGNLYGTLQAGENTIRGRSTSFPRLRCPARWRFALGLKPSCTNSPEAVTGPVPKAL